MILFDKDWEEYPSAIPDTTTKNKSFLHYSGLLKSMGIKNHLFPLQLHNTKLQGVDPFDPDLSIEMMAAISLECKLNFYYYLREVVRVPGGTAEDPILFRANRGNMSLFWSFWNHITYILVQIRQTGKSFSVDELMFYLMNTRCKRKLINLFTKDDKLRAQNLLRLKDIEGMLPFYLKQRGKGDIGNTEEMTVKRLENRYVAHLPSKSPKDALNVGRGFTSDVWQIDEAGFLHNVGISVPSLLAAATAQREISKRNGDPYGTIFTTTSVKKDDRDGRWMYNLMEASAVWSEKFLDCYDLLELEDVVRKNSPKGNLRIYGKFNHRQLGYSDKWLKEAIELTAGTGDDIRRDFFNEDTAGSQMSPLPTHLTNLIRESEVSEFTAQISGKEAYVMRWYVPEDQIEAAVHNEHAVVGIDSSDAVGQDDIAVVVRGVKTGGVLGAANINETNVISFCEWLVEFIVQHERATVIIERRSTGSTILDYLLLMLPARGIDPFARLFNKVVQEAEEFPDRFAEINKPIGSRDHDVYVKHKKHFGFATSGSGITSRGDLYSITLMNASKYTGDKVRDKRIIDQILGLIIKNGRVDHGDGEHDDLCIAWLLSMWFITQGKNLKFYGINSNDILSLNTVNNQINSPQEKYKNHQQQQYREEVERLVDAIAKEKDEYVTHKLELMLKTAVNRLSDDDKRTVAVDDLITKLREYKRNQAKRIR